MATPVVRTGSRAVKPLLSSTHEEARRRVLNLYKAWYRQIPYILLDYDIPKTEGQLRQKLREEFRKNASVKDIRVIDLLVVKGQMELKETSAIHKTKASIMFYFKDTVDPKPSDFMSKFLTGTD